MKSSSQPALQSETNDTGETIIRTTLYELIEAIRSQLPREDDQIVAQTVLHLIQSGKVRYVRPSQGRRISWC